MCLRNNEPAFQKNCSSFLSIYPPLHRTKGIYFDVQTLNRNIKLHLMNYHEILPTIEGWYFCNSCLIMVHVSKLTEIGVVQHRIYLRGEIIYSVQPICLIMCISWCPVMVCTSAHNIVIRPLFCHHDHTKTVSEYMWSAIQGKHVTQ